MTIIFDEIHKIMVVDKTKTVLSVSIS